MKKLTILFLTLTYLLPLTASNTYAKDSTHKTKKNKNIIVASIASASVLLIAGVAGVYFWPRSKKSDATDPNANIGDNIENNGHQPLVEDTNKNQSAEDSSSDESDDDSETITPIKPAKFNLKRTGAIKTPKPDPRRNPATLSSGLLKNAKLNLNATPDRETTSASTSASRTGHYSVSLDDILKKRHELNKTNNLFR